MSDPNGRKLIDYEDAVAMLSDALPDRVHTFRQAGRFALGADWPREAILAALKAAAEIEIAGPEATAMGHGLVIHDDRGALFIATTKADS